MQLPAAIKRNSIAPRAKAAILLVAAGAALLVLFLFDPASVRIYPPCPFHALTGLNCPGCGSLRASHALLHGEFQRALALNPLMVAALPVLVILRLKPSWAYSPKVAWLAAVTLIAYGIVRNCAIWPFLPP